MTVVEKSSRCVRLWKRKEQTAYMCRPATRI